MLRPTRAKKAAPLQNSRIALNHVDRNVAVFGVFPLPYPAIIGACLAGTVEEVGSDVHDLSVGDRVAAYTAFYARKDHKDNRFGAFQHFSLSKAATVVKVKPLLLSVPGIIWTDS
jgi:NADPH:quinone reductase-like Zn-dependent oxidoreductase